MGNNVDVANRQLIEKLANREYVFWINEQAQPHFKEAAAVPFAHLLEAEQRWERFAAYFKVAFPMTKLSDGIIESEIVEIDAMRRLIEGRRAIQIPGRLFLKCDHALPISGSIKARGGVYEVMKLAEKLALEHRILKDTDQSYEVLASDEAKALFSQYKVVVGSTGNLGLSIGTISAKLGFQVTVHMSADAKQWKKDLLREQGVEVIEYEKDYSAAVSAGRAEAEADANSHFVDDENSKDLFEGYAVAGLRLKEQLQQLKLKVDQDHPLFVYIPCGVGGAPGGVAYGLKAAFGEHVYIFFGEPIESPCMTLGLISGKHDEIAVSHIGLTNVTEADGLAVGRPSKFVGKLMEPILNGCYTVDDSFLFRSLKAMFEQENIFMEPSAHAGVFGPIQLVCEGAQFLERYGLSEKVNEAIHLVWSTGGSLVPHEERQHYLQMDV